MDYLPFTTWGTLRIPAVHVGHLSQRLVYVDPAGTLTWHINRGVAEVLQEDVFNPVI